MAQSADGPSGGRLRRLRWRLSGAWLWPAFVVVTLLEMALLHWLPIAGDGSGWIASLLLAGSLNVVAIAVLGGLGGVGLRRRRPDLPKVVADDYAGLAALAVVGLAFLVAGLVHRPELAAEHGGVRAAVAGRPAVGRRQRRRLRARARRRRRHACRSTATCIAPACRSATPSAGCA